MSTLDQLKSQIEKFASSWSMCSIKNREQSRFNLWPQECFLDSLTSSLPSFEFCSLLTQVWNFGKASYLWFVWFFCFQFLLWINLYHQSTSNCYLLPTRKNLHISWHSKSYIIWLYITNPCLAFSLFQNKHSFS